MRLWPLPENLLPLLQLNVRLMPDLAEFYRIDNFIDTFALGHYARVLEARSFRTNQSVAFKLLRPEHMNGGEVRWEYRAFANEADLLMKLADSPNCVRLVDCGYLSAPGEVPMGGEIVSLGVDVAQFRAQVDPYAAQGWRPYLALDPLPRHHNLLYLMKPNQQTIRWRLPSEEGIALALQFGQLLSLAHRKGIVYLDHKLEHVYWDGVKLTVIDLNSSRQVEAPARSSDAHYYRMDIHNLCVGVLYPIFTGLSPQKTMLRPQPSSRSEVEARYSDVTTLDFGAEPSLSGALQALLQRGAAMQIETVEEFLSEMRRVAALHGWDFPEDYTSPASRNARDQLRVGLRKLREGQERIREARDIFREAAIQDGITADLEDELRRLVRSASEMLNNRAIP
jgi:serine/threonine protein kinase